MKRSDICKEIAIQLDDIIKESFHVSDSEYEDFVLARATGLLNQMESLGMKPPPRTRITTGYEPWNRYSWEEE